MQGLGILIELLGLVVDFQLFKEVTERDIEENIEKLKKYTWFQDFLKDDEYRELITYNKNVRHRIGRFNTKKLDKDFYNARCQEKLEKAILKEL